MNSLYFLKNIEGKHIPTNHSHNNITDTKNTNKNNTTNPNQE